MPRTAKISKSRGSEAVQIAKNRTTRLICAFGPKLTNFVACGWSGIEGSPDFGSAILRPPLVSQNRPSPNSPLASLLAYVVSSASSRLRSI
ncbi:hypothetical protein V1278_002746 [Bradyrhizobium sp. AZCC 1577]